MTTLRPFMLVFLPLASVTGGRAAERMDFETHVRPLFKAYCFDCHGEGDKLRGSLDLRLRRLALQGGENGPALVVGKPQDSLLYQPDGVDAVASGSADGWMWAMVKAAHPDEAAALAKAIQNNEWLRLDDELNRLLHPVSASMAFRTCWLLDSAGKTKEALAELKKCAAEGVPLPYDLP